MSISDQDIIMLESAVGQVRNDLIGLVLRSDTTEGWEVYKMISDVHAVFEQEIKRRKTV